MAAAINNKLPNNILEFYDAWMSRFGNEASSKGKLVARTSEEAPQLKAYPLEGIMDELLNPKS